MSPKRDSCDDMTYCFHPAFQFSAKKLFSIKNLSNFREKANAAVGFLSALSFLERHNIKCFSEKDFALDENLLPKIDLSKPDTEDKGSLSEIANFITKIFFKEKEIIKGKIPKQFGGTFEWVKELQKRRNFWIKELLIEILETLYNDRVSVSLPHLYSLGVVWEPEKDFLSDEKGVFSSQNEAFFYILKSWAEIHSFTILRAESKLPYPYSSLAPLVDHFFQEKDESSTFLKECIRGGNDSAVDKLQKLFEDSNEKFLIWSKDTDRESLDVIEKIRAKTSLPFIVFSDRTEKPALKIKEINFLFLLEEGEKWIKDNCHLLGCRDEEEIFRFVANKELLRFSPYDSLFIEDMAENCYKKSDGLKNTESVSLFLQSLKTESQIGKEKLKIRSLIESGQIILALEKIGKIKEPDDELLFLKLWAKSQLKDFNYVLKERNKIRDIKEGDYFSLSLFSAEALWLSGKVDEGMAELEALARNARNDKEKFRILSQIFLLQLNCGETKKAEETLKKLKEINDEEDFKENVLLNYSYAALEKSKNNMENALFFYLESAEWAKKGGYRLFETLLDMEIGNSLRLLGKFEESLDFLRKTVFQAKVLRIKEVEKQAQFDILISEVEKGNLLKVQEEITSLIERREKKVTFAENAIEKYWLSKIMFLRGELIQALEMVEAPLKAERRFLDREIYLSLQILRGNILYAMNDFKSLQILIKKLEDEDILSMGPDFILEYAGLMLLTNSKKIVTLPDKSLIAAKEALKNCSPLSKMTYLLSTARSGDKGSFEAAEEVFNSGEKFNSVLVKAQALLLLYKMNKMPVVSDDELKRIEIFIRENRIKGELCDLLKICEKKKSNVESGEEKLISFLFNSSLLKTEDTLSDFLKFSGVEGVIIFEKGDLLMEGSHPVKEEMVSLIGIENERKMGEFFIYSTTNKNGIWGAITSKEKIKKKQKELLSLYLKLHDSEIQETETDEDSEEDFGIVDAILIGKSKKIVEVKREILNASQFNFPVLITGEAGSGKEVCAKCIHLLSSRAKKEWIAFNCANLTPTLATSQLFGHRKGAFTGADSDREGLVAAAKNSTLFLDEVGEIPLETQAHFLRFLQDGSYQPLGSNISFTSDARIIAATNRNLEEEVRQGRFREDLYYRLKVITIEVPPLRERREDIITLFEKFLEEECEKEKIRKPEVKKGVYLKIVRHNWYGNVRELQNFTKRAIVSSRKSGIIDERMITFEKGRGFSKMTLKEKLENYEKEVIEEILKRNSFNILASAKEAGISRQAFYHRAKKVGLVK